MLNILQGDCIERMMELPADSVHCCVTSPPYWGLRDYGVPGQIGLEPTFDAFLAKLVVVFQEVRRVLRPDGTCWVNMGDSYAGSWGAQGRQGASGVMSDRSVAKIRQKSKISEAQILAHPHRASNTGSLNRTPGCKSKDILGQPWALAFALRASGWYLRQDIIWHKPNPMPESVTDRCTKSHEYIFLLTKSERYFYDQEAIREKGKTRPKQNASFSAAVKDLVDDRNKRSVWSVPTKAYSEAHFATFPPDLIRPCILAGCPVGGTVLDPFGGSGTTGEVAIEEGRKAILIELNPEYIELIDRRTTVTKGLGL